MKLSEKAAKVDKTFADLNRFVNEGEYEYGAMLVRTIVEIIVNSYTDYYVPEIKRAEIVPSIMDQIIALEKCGNFPEAQIHNLHAMRKLSNKGSHQGTEESVNPIQIKAMIPVIENEIKTWKIFVKEGHESLNEIDRSRREALLNGYVEKDPLKVKISLVFTVIAFVAILLLSYKQTMQFFVNGLHYQISELPAYWGCLLAFVICAGYFRSDSKIHKFLYNVLAIYFAAPRLYQVFLCFRGYGTFFESVIYITLAVGILGGYSILALHIGAQKGGIVGYK